MSLASNWKTSKAMGQDLPPLRKPEGKKLKPLSGSSSVGPIFLGLGIALVGLVVAAGLIMFPLSKQEPEEPSIPIPSDATEGSEKVKSEGPPPGTSLANRSQDSAADIPALDTYFSEHGWSARMPDSAQWSAPEDEPSESGLLYRSRVYGPDGAIVVVDFTPSERPNPSNVVGTEPATLPNSPDAQVVSIQGGDLCPAGITCVDYLIPQGNGGYAVLVGWPGNDEGAAQLANEIVASIMPSPGY